jgi:hypothetical protein
MIIDTWALDTALIALSYLFVTTGTGVLIDSLMSAARWKALALAASSVVKNITVKAEAD